MLASNPPEYCTNSNYTDYIYGDGFSYVDNECDFNASVAEIFSKGSSSIFIMTYYQDTVCLFHVLFSFVNISFSMLKSSIQLL